MKANALSASLAYFGIVFAAGFVFGTARVLLAADEPSTRLWAVAIEVPLILAVSWLACGYTLRRFAVPPTAYARGTMGATAFALLMAAEAALGVGLAGRTLSEHFMLYGEASHLFGLAGQVVFALMPVARIRWP